MTACDLGYSCQPLWSASIHQQCLDMSIVLPAVSDRLQSIAICINTISLADNPDLADLFPEQRSLLSYQYDASGTPHVAVLTLERFKDGKAHFHLEAIRQDAIRTDAPVRDAKPVSVQEIEEKCSRMNRKLAHVNFISLFKIPAKDLPQVGLISIVRGVGINFNGIMATIAASAVRFNDSVFKELRWGQPESAEPTFQIELKGTLGEASVSDEVLAIAMNRAIQGFRRLVLNQNLT